MNFREMTPNEIEHYWEKVRAAVQVQEKAKPLSKKYLRELSKEKLLKTSVETVGFSTRVFNCFMNAGIFTVEDIVSKKDYELLRIRCFGRKSLKEVQNLLSKVRDGKLLVDHTLDEVRARAAL